MTAEGGGASPARVPDATQLLGTLNRLVVRACRSRTRRELLFRLVNDTASLCPYDRAVAVRPVGRGAILAVSGQAEVKSDTEFAEQYRCLARALTEPERARCITAEDVPGAEDVLQRVVEAAGGASPLWIPLEANGRLVAGLWLERWEGGQWEDAELALLQSFAEGAGAGWEKFEPRGGMAHLQGSRWSWSILLVAVAALLGIAAVMPVRLKVVAPCEIAAEAPAVVAAPLAGVVESVAVQPGEEVEPGDELFRYDPREVGQELRIARREVAIVQARLERAQSRAFHDDEALRDVTVLEHRLAQAEIRLARAEEKQQKLVVRAERAGQVVIERPHEWRGKPTRVGERVLLLVDPKRTKLRVWIAESDNVEVDRDIPIQVFLEVAPDTTLKANLGPPAPAVTLSPRQVPSFLAEARWDGEPPEAIRIGLQGTAILRGREVSLLYWIGRRPLTAIRRWFGI